ncbi:MAG TPA: DUF3313 domain-containing protein [Myxococcota bacterium]|nr:DUF3313 domain-containing protein [Myxococcota bacterium]
MSRTSGFASVSGAVLIGVAAWLAGCSATIPEKPVETPKVTGFLGTTYDKLQPGDEGQAALRYVASDVDWKQYKALLLEPVQFWAGDDSKVEPETQQMLTTYFYNAIKADLTKHHFKLVDLPGPGVIRVQIAITDVTTAVPVLRTVSVIVPQARILNQAQSLISGKYAFSGSAEVALKATDSQTGQILAAAIDRRAGGGSVTQAAQWQWGDAKAAMDFWAERFTQRLAELQQKKVGSK